MLRISQDTVDAVAAPLPFWRCAFAQNVLPLATSVLFHASLVIIGLLTARAIQLVYQTANEMQVVIPDMTSVPFNEAGVILHQGLGGDPNREAFQDRFPDVPRTGLGETPSLEVTKDIVGGGSGTEVQSELAIGVGKLDKLGMGEGVGTGKGPRSGGGTGKGIGLTIFGPPGGGSGTGPAGRPGPMPDSSRDVVFVMDASGSMMQKFDALRIELNKAINALRPPSSFNVLFFQEAGVGEVDHQLLFATPNNKQKAADFMDRTVPRGETHPEAALEAAFAQHPQVIFLLTDGDFPDNKSVVETIRRLDANKSVRVNTIAFLDRGEEYEKVLKQIAEETGGTFRYVSEADLSQ